MYRAWDCAEEFLLKEVDTREKSKPDFAKALATVGAIRTLVKQNHGGYDDAGARNSIKKLIRELRPHYPSEPSLMEVTGSLLTWADILYSARKHAAYGDPERVRSFILADCSRLDKVIQRGESATGTDGA